MIAPIAGFLAGSIHVCAGPDHLAAVAPLAAESREKGWLTGLNWGFGHALGIAIIGGLFVMLRDVLPLEWLSGMSERLVGVLLIGIGLWGFRKAMVNRVHCHEHNHEHESHLHFHVHSGDEVHQHDEPIAHQHSHAALGIGVLHGFAGSSHFLAVLPALAFPTRLEAVAYLLAYGIGTLFSMTAFSYLISQVAVKSRRFGGKQYQRFLIGISVAAISVGAFWLV